MKWLSNRLFSNFKMEQAEDITRDGFDEKNYSIKFNLPSFRELGNVYNEKFMNFF